ENFCTAGRKAMSHHPETPSNARAFTRRDVLRDTGRAGLTVAIGIGAVARTASVAGAASKVTIAYIKAGLTCEGAVFVAQQQGYFRDEGLDLATVALPG